MKKLLLLLLLCMNFCKAQDVSIGLSPGFKTFSGNNFLTKSYESHLATIVDMRLNVYKNFGFGGYFSYARPNIKSTEYVGNSDKARITEVGGFVFYKHSFNKNIAVLPKFGIAHYQIKNDLKNYTNRNYFTNGTIFNFGAEGQYRFNEDISTNLSFDYGYIDLSNIRASNSLGTSYQSATQFGVSIGIRFWF